MANASGKKNSRQLFSYPSSLLDKLVGWGNQSILCFLKPSSSLPSVSPSSWAGLWRDRDILVHSSSFLPSHHTPCFFTLHPTSLRTPATDLILSFVCFPDKITGQVQESLVCWAIASQFLWPTLWREPTSSLFTTCWSSSYQPCLPRRPVRNSFSQFPSFTRLFQDWHTEIEKNTESFCAPRNKSHQNKPRSVAKLWLSFPLPALFSPPPPSPFATKLRTIKF